MVQAAAEGVIDFSQAVPNDTWWWIKVGLLLKAMEKRNNRDMLRLYIQASLAAVSNARIKGESYEKLMDNVNTDISTIRKTLQPWVKEMTPEDIASEAGKMWEEMYGDLNDPATKELIANALDALRK